MLTTERCPVCDSRLTLTTADLGVTLHCASGRCWSVAAENGVVGEPKETIDDLVKRLEQEIEREK